VLFLSLGIHLLLKMVMEPEYYAMPRMWLDTSGILWHYDSMPRTWGMILHFPKRKRTHHPFTSIRKGLLTFVPRLFSCLGHLGPKHLRQTWLNIDRRHDPSVFWCFVQTKLPPTKNLAWNLKMRFSKFGISFSQGSMFSFHVSFRGCMGILTLERWKQPAEPNRGQSSTFKISWGDAMFFVQRSWGKMNHVDTWWVLSLWLLFYTKYVVNIPFIISSIDSIVM